VAAPATIKTPYGLFVEALTKWLEAYNKMPKTFTAEQDGRILLNPALLGLRKLARLINQFPVSNRALITAANRVLNYREYDVKYTMYASGLQLNAHQHQYYARQRDHYLPALAEWDKLLVNTSLIVEKEMNTIAEAAV